MMHCQMSCNSGIQVKETHVVGRPVGICTIVIWDDNADIGHKLFDVLVRTGPDSELARMNTLVSLSPNVKRTILST